MNAIDLIKVHEALRLHAYTDTRGKTTIGYGRNLTDNGITPEEALMMLSRDYNTALNDALAYPWFDGLADARKAVILDMLFNLGRARFAGFVRMIDAIEVGNFKAAAAEMLNSAWAREVGDRAVHNAQMMDSGEFAD